MSFSFSFLTKTKTKAHAMAEAQRAYPYVPGSVVDFIQAQIECLAEDAVFKVSASGHSLDGSSLQYGPATAAISVEALRTAD